MVKLVFPERAPADVSKVAKSRDFQRWRKAFGRSEKNMTDDFLLRLGRAMLVVSYRQQRAEAETVADVAAVGLAATHQLFNRAGPDDGRSTPGRAVSTPAASGLPTALPTTQPGGPRTPASVASGTAIGRTWSTSIAQQQHQAGQPYATGTRLSSAQTPRIQQVSSRSYVQSREITPAFTLLLK